MIPEDKLNGKCAQLVSYFIGPADAYGGDYSLYKTILPMYSFKIRNSSKSGNDEEDLDVAHDPSKSHSVGKSMSARM